MTTLQFLRIRSGLKQSELAALVKLSQPDVSVYERGKPLPSATDAALLATFRERLGTALDVGPILRKLREGDLERPWEIVLVETFGRP